MLLKYSIASESVSLWNIRLAVLFVHFIARGNFISSKIIASNDEFLYYTPSRSEGLIHFL